MAKIQLDQLEIAANGVTDKTLYTYRNHLQSISHFMDITIPLSPLAQLNSTNQSLNPLRPDANIPLCDRCAAMLQQSLHQRNIVPIRSYKSL